MRPYTFAIAEIVGLIALIVALLYLARRLHQRNGLPNEQASYRMLQTQLSYTDGIARESELVDFVYGIPKENQALTMQKKAEFHVFAEFFRWHWEFPEIRKHSVPPKEADLLLFPTGWS